MEVSGATHAITKELAEGLHVRTYSGVRDFRKEMSPLGTVVHVIKDNMEILDPECQGI